MGGTQRFEGTWAFRILWAGDWRAPDGARRKAWACLEADGHRIVTAESAASVHAAPSGASFDLVITADELPDRGAVDRVRSLRADGFAGPIIVLSAAADVATCEAAMRVGADRFLRSGEDLERLSGIVRDLAVRGQRHDRRRPVMTANEARGLRERELFEELERLLIETRGNIAEIARRIGRDRSTVRYHLKRFGMLEEPASAPLSRDRAPGASG